MGDKVKVLIVDDKPEKLLALEAVLEDLNQTIIRAYSGREALRALLNDEFAVILLDVNMPGMDGFETAAMIRQRKSTENTPIIFVTAFGDETHSIRGYSLGAVDYIQTPVVPEVLKTKVAVFVDLYKKTDQVRRQSEIVKRRAAQLQKLAAASMAINSSVAIERMLQTVADSARDIVGAHQAICLCLADPYPGQRHNNKSQAVTSFSDKYAQWRGRKLDLAPVATTLVAQSKTATRMTAIELHEHPDWEIVRQLEFPPIEGGMLAAPLAGRDGSNLGILYLADRYDGGDFTNDDEAVLVQLAQMASIAIENTIFAEERETNRIKDEFLSVLSHELRTPLNAILGWTQLLRMSCEGRADNDPDGGASENDTAHGLEVIERNAKAQAKLVEDLLDVSRVTTGKLRLNKRPIGLVSIVSAAIDAIRPTAESKQITLAMTCADGAADGDLQLNGDPDRLQQVVWNLLSNAMKFTPPKGSVEAILDRVGSDLRLRVVDTGHGISPAFLPYVFDRFRQADSTSTRSHGGLGIGLTIVRHIVEMHGGTVAAESAGEGRGATFIVTLPAANLAVIAEPEAAGVAAEPAGRAAGAAAVPAPPDRLVLETQAPIGDAAGRNGEPREPERSVQTGADTHADSAEHPAVAAPAVQSDAPAVRPNGKARGKRGGRDITIDLSGIIVLVVDDEADAREVMSVVVRRAGAEVIAAGSAAEALSLISRGRPDIIVSDIAMPDRDGYDLIRTIRQLPQPQGGQIPAVALTAYAREEDRIRSLSSGYQAHLTKPVSSNELVATIAHLVVPSRGASTTPAMLS